MTLEAIKEAIKHLPERERWKLAGWFEEMEDAAWDEDIKRDFAPGGKGELLALEIRREISEGNARPLEEGGLGSGAAPLRDLSFAGPPSVLGSLRSASDRDPGCRPTNSTRYFPKILHIHRCGSSKLVSSGRFASHILTVH